MLLHIFTQDAKEFVRSLPYTRACTEIASVIISDLTSSSSSHDGGLVCVKDILTGPQNECTSLIVCRSIGSLIIL